MAFFDLFKKKPAEEEKPAGPVFVSAVTDGAVVPMKEVPDEAFASGVMGWCCGIEPENGAIKAPADGTVLQVASSFHAFGIDCENGVKVIIHAGIDTVAMKGAGFQCSIREGDKVKKGDTLLNVDLDAVRKAGYPAIVIMAVLNTDDYSAIELAAQGTVKAGTDLIRLEN